MAERDQSVAGVPVAELPPWQVVRRQRIVDAARAALEAQEYEEIHVSGVARDAGVAQGTLYRYFSSKEHLYAAVLRSWLAEQHNTREDTDAADRVRRQIRAVVGAFVERPRYCRVLTMLHNTADPHARRLFAEAVEDVRAPLARVLAPWGPAADDVAEMAWAIALSLLTSVASRGRSVREASRITDRFVDLVVARLGVLEGCAGTPPHPG